MRKMILALLLSLSCGSSSTKSGDLAACGDFTACGGSPVGTWKLSKYCTDGMTMTFAECTMTMDLGGFDPSGTYTFSSDGTYRTQTTVSGTMEIGYSKGCLSDNKTCDNMVSSSSLKEGVTVDCASASGGGCQCTEKADNFANTEEGTYTISGSLLTMTRTESSGTSPMDFCVQGNTLKLHSTTPEGDETTIEISGSTMMVLTKQ